MIAVLPLAILSMLRFGVFFCRVWATKKKENQLRYHLSLEYIADQGLLSSWKFDFYHFLILLGGHKGLGFGNNFEKDHAILEIITHRSQEGSQFVRGFKGIVGILLWKGHFGD